MLHGAQTQARGHAYATLRKRLLSEDSIGASAILAIERGVLHHPLHQLVKCYACVSSKLWNK